MMSPEIKRIEEKKLLGRSLKMSLANNHTAELWKSFMPLRREITNSITNDLISMAVYDPAYFTNFNPVHEFEKWAAVEVTDLDNATDKLEKFTLKAGLYAVFHYKGSGTDMRIFQYIFEKWLPESGFLLDDRPHFEILGEKYKNDHPDSEEEIWIPIREK